MKTSQTEIMFDFLMFEFHIDKTQIVNFWDSDNCALVLLMWIKQF